MRAGSPTVLPREKILYGLTRLLLIVVLVCFPLLQYSTFNPSTTPNDITQIDASVSLQSTTQLYTSTLLRPLAYPGPLAQWLKLTRPFLGSFDISTGEKSVQLLELASCSSSVWTISPQGRRIAIDALATAMEANTSLSMLLTINVGRQSTGPASLTNAYTMPPEVIRRLLATINSTNATDIIQLPNFYSPFVFNAPAKVSFFPQYAGVPSVDMIDCSVALRNEYDVVLSTTVWYWCLQCNSMFTSSNFPNGSHKYFPETDCLNTGRGCQNYNFEAQNTRYTPTKMYFTVFTDRVPVKLSFLPDVGIVALYTTFVVAIGQLIRSSLSSPASSVFISSLQDPTPLWQWVRYIFVARECGEYRLEQALTNALINLLRSPETLLRVTKLTPVNEDC